MKVKYDIVYFLGLLACVFFLLNLASQLEAPLDPGDGLNHFFMAQIAPSQPIFYLNHWGKPLFTLFSSPFAYFGMNGMIGFNVLLFVGTCLFAFSIFKQLKVNLYIAIFFPLILLFSFDYTSTVLSGLTEILFGFLLVLGSFFLVKRKFFWMAIVLSFLPFSRSEGQLVILLALFVLIYNKAYRFIPLLISGHLIYAFVGLFAFHDFFWYFNQNPYPAHSIYGRGEWNHFWIFRKQIMGTIGLYLAAFAGISLVHILISNKLKYLRIDFLFLAFASFFGILLAHAYFWKFGLNGSLGLTRVITMVFPVFIIACLYLIQSFHLEKLAFSKYIFTALFVLITVALLRKKTVEFAGNQSYEKSLLQAANFLKNKLKKHQKVYYFHPLIAYGLGSNMYGETERIRQMYVSNNPANLAIISNGDFLIRDSHFGPMEMGLSLEMLQLHPEFALVNEFIPSEFGTSFHGEAWNVKVFQKIPVSLQEKTTPISTFLALKKQDFTVKSTAEFTPILETVLKGTEQVLSIQLHCEKEGGFLVCDQNNGASWSSVPLLKGESVEIQFPIQKNNTIKLYFWNPSQIENTIQIRKIWKTKTVFQPIRTHIDTK